MQAKQVVGIQSFRGTTALGRNKAEVARAPFKEKGAL